VARLANKAGKEIVLSPVRANAGIRAAYRRRLMTLVDEMITSYRHWLEAAYRANPPALAQDATPAKELERELKRLARRWQKQFDDAAPKLAAYFAKSAAARSSSSLRSILRNGGWSVKFTMTAAMRDVLAATVAENVSLIRSIPSEFRTQVEGLVMRSVTAGRDLSVLSKSLENKFALPRNRAILISRDQNNKATAVFTRARYLEMGVKEAIWLHSAGGKTPRPTHVKKSGKRYDVAKGWLDPAVGRYIFPGELINCRCVARPVVKGFS
jgi:SPP1 gp7 family putative phage head morphogenesis protein